MTIAFLLRNTLQAARMARTKESRMDLRRLRRGELLAGVSGGGLLAVLFADWFGGETRGRR